VRSACTSAVLLAATAAAYIVCAWNALDGTPQKKTFFPELIKKVAAVPPPVKGR
jgi:hypothetical protein